jgi:hypothetical protein
VELQPGHMVEFGVSRISSVRVQDMQQLWYFGNGVGRVLGAEEIPEPKGELVVFEAFFIAGLRLPAHCFVAEVLQRFEVQVHQLTPNAMVALAKYVWAVTSYGGQPSVEVFAKNYYLHWQKRKIGGKIAQFGSCTFTPRTGKTSAEVVELVPCARNKWGNWWDYWFYVSGSEVEDLPGLPATIMCSHYYVAFPPFEVAEDDENEGALRCTARIPEALKETIEYIICHASGKRLSKEEEREAQHYAQKLKYLKGGTMFNDSGEEDFLYCLPDSKEISVCREMSRSFRFPTLEDGLSVLSKDELADSLAYNSIKVCKSIFCT